MSDFFSDGTANEFIVAKSRIMLNIDAGSHNMIRIPRNSFIMGVWLWVKAAYGTTSSINIGFSGNGETADPDAFLDATSMDITRAGMYCSMRDSLALSAMGKYFTGGSGLITLTYVKGNAAVTASCQVFISSCELY